MDLARFTAYLHRRLTELEDEGGRKRLEEAPWRSLAEVVARELPAVLSSLPAEPRALLLSWEHSGAGGVWLDADRPERAFSDGPIDPRPVLDASPFFPSCFGCEPSALSSEVLATSVECLTFLCAEVLLQHADPERAKAWVLAVQPGHDETPRVVSRGASPASSVFDEQGEFACPSDEELIERTPDEGHALAKLIADLGASTDTMNLLGKVGRAFHRVALSGRSEASRAEARALAVALAAHHQRLRLASWGSLYEEVMAKALVCSIGDRETFELVRSSLRPAKQLEFPGLAFNLACLHALFGDRPQALEAVEAALHLGTSPAAFDDADFDSLRDDPDFRSLLAEPSEEALTAQLAEAVRELELEKVEALIAQGADVNGEHDGDAMLTAAFSAAHTKQDRVQQRAIVSALMDAGATLSEGEWPWYRIVRDAELLSLLLDRGVAVSGALVAQVVEKENLATLELLVARGVKLAPHAPRLHDACRHHRAPQTLRYLVAQGVDFSVPHEGTPFALGFGSAGNVVMLDAVLALGLDVHGRDGGGGCLISHALFNDQHEVVRWAIDHGAALDVTDRRGVGLVLAAIDAGAAQSLLVLLEAGAPVDLSDQLGRTALHAAAERNNAAFVRALLARGASVSALDGEGQRPIDRAERGDLKALLAP